MKKHILVVFLIGINFLAFAQEIDFDHIGPAQGLSQISVMSIYQDELGYMWFGTGEGLNRYNGNIIDIFQSEENDSTGLESNIINKICGDGNGLLYLICGYTHLMTFDLKQEKFNRVSLNAQAIAQGKKSIWYAANNHIYRVNNVDRSTTEHYRVDSAYSITRLYENSNGKLYIGTVSGLYVLDANHVFNCILPKENISAIYEDSKKNLWVGTRDNGVFRLDRSNGISHFQRNFIAGKTLSSNIIRDFCEDNFGQIWIATFNGLDKFTPENEHILNYRHSGNKPTDLSHTSIYKLFKDKQGTIWIGTYYGGVNYYNPEANIYTYYYPSSRSTKNINFPIVGKMTEDKDENLWICTEGGGLNYYDRKNKVFQAFTTDTKSGIAHNNLKCIWYSPENDKLYLGTHMGGLSIYDRKSNRFKNISTANNPLFPNDVIETLIPYRGNLIILTQKGLVQLDMKTEKISPFFTNPDILNKIRSDNTTCHIDMYENLWLAKTDGGVRCYNLISGDFKEYNHSFTNPGSIGRHNITKIFETKKGKLLFATMGSGLFEFVTETNEFIMYTQQKDGLISDFIYDMDETNFGYVALLTNKGLNLFDPESKRNYYLDKTRGMPLETINFGCGIYTAKNGEIFVGGTEGMASFYESQLNFTHKDYTIFFSDILVNNRLIRPGDETGIIDVAMPYKQRIKLNYKQTNLIIRFGTSNNIKANRSKFEYQLNGFDGTWYQTNGQSIQYSNLSPGSYTLFVREIVPVNTNQKPKTIQLEIRVSPPFYASTLAYLIYLLLLLGIIWRIIAFNNSKILLKTSLEYEIKENDHIKELNQAKLQFFTNISHEFRTPLTLIIGQIEALSQMDSITPPVYNKLAKIYKNTSHLKSLITELLDFRKQEQGLFRIKVSNHDIVEFVRNIYNSFNDLAKSKKIDYSFYSAEKSSMLWFDPNQLQKVFYNIISNAFKFSPEYSSISVKIERGDDSVRVSIADSGIGVDDEDIPHLFERFYQAKNSNQSQTNTGAGIGLNLAKGIVELHHGNITAEKRTGDGMLFKVTLLTGKEHFLVNELDNKTGSDVDYVKTLELPDLNFFEEIKQLTPAVNKSTILIVEDNEEMMQFLTDIFTQIYEVHIASDGAEGLEKVKTLQPDIVLSDVMMPKMSGKEMCVKIKTNFETSHIPVVLLTADSSEETNLEGLMIGADDYITKPFNVKMLISRCNNLVMSRKKLQEKFSKQIDNTTISIATNKLDQELLDKATEIVMNHLDDYDFNVSVFAQEMTLGRSKLYLKLKGIIGMTPNDFIINVRLKTAASMLINDNDLNISDITYRLGFNTPRYFSKCFKDLFGISPLNYRKQNNPYFAGDDNPEGEKDDNNEIDSE
ncbi:MAG: two-component regulator propeller domain-containing protein [Paludibacteraceae bacterium]